MPAVGSAKPREPPDPGAPNELALPKGHSGLDFMKPNENWMLLLLMHSSWKPRIGGIAGAANKSSVSWRSPSSRPPAAKTP